MVFFQHGLLDAANDWISNDIDKAPAFIMAKAGYDVWLGNNRGNFNSPDTSPSAGFTSKSDPEKYYNYSFQKLGEYDLPAQTNLALQMTGQPNLTYIGHS